MTYYNRRRFLKNTAGLGLAGVGGIAPLIANLPAVASTAGGYKALVFVFLQGGMDNWDTLIPVNSDDDYISFRQSLLTEYGNRDNSDLISAVIPHNNAASLGDREFSLPPEFGYGRIRLLYIQKKAAIVANVGPLLAPTVKTDIDSGVAELPPQLFSHNDQQATWMSFTTEGGRPEDLRPGPPSERMTSQPGWGALISDRGPGGGSDPLSTIALQGSSIFLRGDSKNQYVISAAGPVGTAEALRLPTRYGLADDRFIANFLNARPNDPYGRKLKRAYQSIYDNALMQADRVNGYRGNVTSNFAPTARCDAPGERAAAPSSCSLEQQLGRVAELIEVGKELGLQRQVFFVTMGGYDTHNSQARDLSQNQHGLAFAITNFQNEIAKTTNNLNEDEITLFTGSDFGRSLVLNDDGTDHGWGGHHFVVGGAVKGGKIYGSVPRAELGHMHDAGNGRLIPTLSVEEYVAPLARWFGVDDAALNTIFPRLNRFEKNVTNGLLDIMET